MPQEIRSTAEFYHVSTMYDPSNIAKHPGIDWSNKPELFKLYAGAESIELRNRLPIKPSQVYQFEAPDPAGDEPISLEALARLLFATYGVTAIAHMPGETHFYRSAPSAGALYPSEVYVAIRNHPEIPSGIYNFLVTEHRLQRIAPEGLGSEGDELYESLTKASLGHPAFAQADLCVVVSSIFFRSSWRYRERGYRRCMLDAGHVIGNLCAYAPLEGYSAVPVSGFVDSEVNELLGLNSALEGVCALLPLVRGSVTEKLDRSQPEFAGALRSNPFAPVLSPDEDQLVDALCDSTSIERSDAALVRTPPTSGARPFSHASALAHQPTKRFEGMPQALTESLFPALLMRRSARRLRRGASISLDQLASVLEYAYRFDLVAGAAWETPGFFAPELLDTWVVAHNVDGLDSGTWHYDPKDRALRLCEAGRFSNETQYLCLQQELGGDASAVILHTCDLPRAVERYGNRAYRTLHLDAGHLGERMMLAAIVDGLGMSGIGGFFDLEVNRLLGIPEDEACVYINCLGVPDREPS